MTDAPPATTSDILLDALVQIVRRHRDRYGVYLDGVTDVDVRQLARQLGGPGEVYVSLIGLDDADALVAWARDEGWDELGFGAEATHAVAVRNDAPAEAVKVALAGADSDRSHSLTERGYLRVGAAEVLAEVARMGQDQASNDPQRNLWDALARPDVAATLSLADVLGYAADLAASDDPLGAPRTALPRLGLLRDPALFAKGDAAAIAARLQENRALVERILRAGSDDRKKAFDTLQAATDLDRDQVQAAYAAFLDLARGDVAALSDLTVGLAQRLLRTTKPAPAYTATALKTPVQEPPPGDDADDGPEPQEPDDRAKDPTQAALDLAAVGNLDALADLAEAAEAHLREKGAEPETVSAGGVSVSIHADTRALDLVRAFVSETRFGGVVQIEGTLDDALAEIGEHETQWLGDVEIEELLLWTERFGDALPEFNGHAHLREYLDRRRALLPHLDLLTADPIFALAALDGLRDAAQIAVDAYVRLLSHLKDQFAALQAVSREAAADVVARVVALDLAVFYGETPSAVVLPTSPLTLWKHLELAGLVRQRAGTLSEADLELLRGDLDDLPEPLLALYVPASAEHEAVEMAHVGRVGTLSRYSPTAIQTADVDAQSIEDAAVRLAMLYPPARRRLRIALLDPESLHPVAAALRRGTRGGLLQGKSAFDHVDIRVITSADANPPEVSDVLGELHAQGRVTLRQSTVAHRARSGAGLRRKQSRCARARWPTPTTRQRCWRTSRRTYW